MLVPVERIGTNNHPAIPIPHPPERSPMPTTEPKLTIQGASQATGVPATTLRAWESRYGIARPQRTEAGYRVYDEHAIAEIRRMQEYLKAGATPRLAADAVIRTRAEVTSAADDGPTPALSPGSAPTPRGLPPLRDLLHAAVTLDERRLAAALDVAFSTASFDLVLDRWLFPALREVGLAWERGELDVSAEHLVSAAVMRRLAALYDAAGFAPSAPRVLVGLPPGSEHEIPPLSFAIAARRAGLGAIYLGPNLPADSWVSASLNPGVRAVVVSVRTHADLDAAGLVARAVHAARPDVRIAIGGPAAAALDKHTVSLAGSVPESARLLADLLH